ncbi:MAG: hypothetical protein LBO71_06805 [Prevotellaceae bacterium]|nr:hypothetical protein [Prevotellaceae bacterium]
MLTMLEYNDGHGNRIYTVEAINIEAKEKPAGPLTDGKPPQVPIAGFASHESREHALNDFSAKIQHLIEIYKKSSQKVTL